MKRKITASAYVLDDQNRLLCVFHNKFGKWVQPGGHVEEDETPLETAYREVFEETGINIKFLSNEPIEIISYDTVVGKQLDYQYVAMPLTTKITHNKENKEAKFLTLEEIKSLNTVDDLEEMYYKVLLYKEGEIPWTKELSQKKN